MPALLLRHRGVGAHRHTSTPAPAYLTFDGLTNGSAPPSPWVVQASGTGTGVVVQSNRLQFTSGSSGGSYIGARAYMAGAGWDVLTDFDRVATLTVESPIVGQYCNFCLRMDSFTGNGDYPVNGYIVSFRPQSGSEKLIIAKASGGTFSQKVATDIFYSAGMVLKLWMKVTGATTPVIKVWVWPNGGTAPTSTDTPTLTWTDPSSPFTSGRWGFGASSDGASKVATIDDIGITEPTSSGGGGSSGGGTAVPWSDGTPIPWSDGSAVNWSS